MKSRFAFAAVVSTAISAFVFAQEDPLHPARSTSSPSAPSSSPAGTTPPLSSAATPTPAGTPVQLTDVLFKNLKARSIGPAVMGGRVSDIALDPHNPFVFFVGLHHGGGFKPKHKGVTFDPIFVEQPMLSGRAIAVVASDSDVSCVGTGETDYSSYYG